MFLGHFAAALSGTRATARPSLGWLFAACQLPDLIWPVLVLAGVERVSVDPGNTAYTPLSFDHYPWSHSLLTVAVQAVVLGGMFRALRRDGRGAVVVGALVVSHWLLDALTHRPDLPLWPGGDARIGLGLWNNVPATLALELAFFGAALAFYAGGTRGQDRVGRAGFIVLVAFLVGSHLAAAFGPPPPDATIVAGSALAIWALVPIAAWVDRHRAPRALS